LKGTKTINRRRFAKGLALAPWGIAASSRLLGQQVAPATETGKVDSFTPEKKPAPDPGKRPPIHETEPFAESLVFVRREAQPRVRPFSLNQVQLDSGPLQQARDWNRAYMMRLDNDRLLHNFRVTAGLPSDAEPLGGWEAPTSELRGHFVGHYLSACSMLYLSTGDHEVRAKGDSLVAGIAACQAKLDGNGYVSAFPEDFFDRLDKREKVWAPFYTIHKIMAGLFDMHAYADSQQALDILLKLAAWVDVWTAAKSEEHMQEILKTEYGGMNEVLYNLSGATGDDRWARTGDRFNKKTFFTPLALRRDELYDLHANTHIPQVIGAARRYELSSDYRFRDVSEFFWETVTEARTYVTGGSGNAEAWLTHPNHLSIEMKASSHHQECCCSYNMMKLTRHLYGWTGDPRFIDYYERNLLNHRLGAIQPETGLTTYFLSMSPGAWKTICTEDQTFWCCGGTALEDYAKLNDSVYFHDEDSLYVNLFVSSKLDWTERHIRLRQETKFPEVGATMLIIESTPEAKWTMRLRIPAWISGASSVRINGRTLEGAASPGSYLSIHRVWKPGDRVELTTPMQLTSEGIRDDLTLQAFLYGPVVLAGHFPMGKMSEALLHKNQGPEIQDAPLDVPGLTARGTNPAHWIEPVPGQPLTFRTTGQAKDVTLKPLNQSWERFAVYWTVS
jgi:uncharacterized protein